MKQPVISQPHRHLEKMFGALEIGSIEHSPLSFKLKPVDQSKWDAGWHIVGLIFLNVISLIAYIVLIALRHKLTIDLKNYNNSSQEIPIQDNLHSQPSLSLHADPVETPDSNKEDCDTKMGKFAIDQGYFYCPFPRGFMNYTFVGDFQNPAVVECSDEKIHISVDQSDENMLNALMIIVNIIKKSRNSFKIVESEFRTKNKSANLAGKAFTVYLKKEQTKEDALAMARELNEALTKQGIIQGPCSLADIPIFDNGFIYSRQPNSIDSEYVAASRLKDWGFTRYEACSIGLEDSLFGKDLAMPPQVKDFRQSKRKEGAYGSMSRLAISFFLSKIFVKRGISEDFLDIFCPPSGSEVNQTFNSLFQEVQSHFYFVFDEKTPMGPLYPALYHAIIKPLAKLGIMQMASEERIDKINDFLIEQKDSIVKYLLDCAMRRNEDQIFNDEPTYKVPNSSF